MNSLSQTRLIFLYSSFSSSSKENETHGDKEFLFWNIDPNLGIKQNALAPTFTPDNRKCRTCTFSCFLTYSGFLPNRLTHAVWYCRLWFQSENVAVRELDGIYLTWYSQLNLYQPFSIPRSSTNLYWVYQHWPCWVPNQMKSLCLKQREILDGYCRVDAYSSCAPLGLSTFQNSIIAILILLILQLLL